MAIRIQSDDGAAHSITLASDCRHCDGGNVYATQDEVEQDDPENPEIDDDGFWRDQRCGECDGDGYILTENGRQMAHFLRLLADRERAQHPLVAVKGVGQSMQSVMDAEPVSIGRKWDESMP